MLKTALSYGFSKLDLREFIDVTKFHIQELLPVYLLWNSFQEDIPIYINNDLIKIFGYKGELKKQKENLLKLVNKFNIPIIKMDNDEYVKFLKMDMIKYYPEITKEQLKSKPNHCLIMPADLEKLFLSVDTINGQFFKEYYINIKNLFFLYFEYQCLFYKKKYEDELNKIYNLPHQKEYKINNPNPICT